MKIICLFQLDVKSSSNYICYPPVTFFFGFSHQTEKSIIHPALEGEKKKTVKAKAIEYCSQKLDTIPACVTVFQCGQVRLEKWLVCSFMDAWH